jgi:cell division GTPase FtsZ
VVCNGRAAKHVSRSSILQKRKDHKLLTQFPAFAETYGKKIAVVGISTRGCKIAYDLSVQLKQLGNFIYLTCDEGDVANVYGGKKIVLDASKEYDRTPSKIRGLVFSQMYKISEALQGAQVTFIIVGLGGSVGSGLAPLVAKCAKQVHSMVVGIVSMPFNFEKHKYFFAGCALRQLRAYSDGIMLIENEAVINLNMPIIDAYAELNEGLSLALNSMLEPVEKDGTNNGVLNIVDFIKANPYSVLRPSEGKARETDLNSEIGSNYLVSYQSIEDTTKLINSYDPVDLSLRQGNLDSGFDSSLGYAPNFLQNLESD